MRCPICDKQFEADRSSAVPFCSERCRSIDLLRWLNESYSLPIEDESSEASIENRLNDPDGNGRAL